MESVRIKGNARKSTYSGKPTASAKPRASVHEQLRLRQASEPESNVNHVPAKPSSTTWKRSGWSLSARVRHSSREDPVEGLLTPMEVNKDNEKLRHVEALNGDGTAGSGNAENVAGGEKKSPDQRSLWSLFSAPKVQEHSDENKSRVYGISNGTSKRQELTPNQAAVARDQSTRKQEEKDSAEKTQTPSFNLLSKMKPFKKNASRNFFAQLGKKPADATASEDKVKTNSVKDTENAVTVPHTTRVGNRTKDALRKKSLDEDRTADKDRAGSKEKIPKRRLSLRDQVNAHSSKKADVSDNHDAAVDSIESKETAERPNISENVSTGARSRRLRGDDRTSDPLSKNISIRHKGGDADIADGREQHPKRRSSLAEQVAAHSSKETNVSDDQDNIVLLNTSTGNRADTRRNSLNVPTTAHKRSDDNTTGDGTSGESRKTSLDSRTGDEEMADKHAQHPRRRHSLREQVTAFSNKGRTCRTSKETKDASEKEKLLALKSTDFDKEDNVQTLPENTEARTLSSDSPDCSQGRQKKGRTEDNVERETVFLAKDADISEKAWTEIQNRGRTSPMAEEEKDKTTASAKQTEKLEMSDSAIKKQGSTSPMPEEEKKKTKAAKEKLESDTDKDMPKKFEKETQKHGRISPVSQVGKNKSMAAERQAEKSDKADTVRTEHGRVSPLSEEVKSQTSVKEKLASEAVSLAKDSDVSEKNDAKRKKEVRISLESEETKDKPVDKSDTAGDGRKKHAMFTSMSGEAKNSRTASAEGVEKLEIADPTKGKRGIISPVQKDISDQANIREQAGEADKAAPVTQRVIPLLVDRTKESSSLGKQTGDGGKSKATVLEKDRISSVPNNVVEERDKTEQTEELKKLETSKLTRGRSSPLLEDMTKLLSVLPEQHVADKALSMPTLTLPSNIRYPRTTSNVSSDTDEEEILFIDENLHEDQSSDHEDLGKGEDDESHVLRVWSLQSEEETSSDFMNLSGSFSVDAESSFGPDIDSPSPAGLHASASQPLDDNIASAVIESLSSLDVSKPDDKTDTMKKLDGDVSCDELLKSCMERSETADAQHVKAESRPRRNSDEGPPTLQAQPNTHHLLQELDSLLECSTFQSETQVNESPEASKEMPQMDTCDHSNNDRRTEDVNDIELEPTRNIFSLFGGSKRSLPATNIVKLDLGNNTKQSSSSSYRSVLPEDSIVLAGSCSGERDNLMNNKNLEHSVANTSSHGKSADTVSNNKSLETGIPAMSSYKPVQTVPPFSSRNDSSVVVPCSSSDKLLETGPSTVLCIQSPKHVPSIPSESLQSGNSQSLETGLTSQSSETSLPNQETRMLSNKQDDDHVDVPSDLLPATSVTILPALESSDASLPTLSSIASPDNGIPSLTLETDGEDDEGLNSISISSQPPELCMEVTPSPAVNKDAQRKSPLPPEPEEVKMDDVPFLAFESRDDLFSYSKSSKMKIQRRGSQAAKAPAKKVIYPVVKNVKMKRRRPSPLAAKIKALERDLLLSMANKRITEIVHPSIRRKGIALGKVKKYNLFVNVRTEELERTSLKNSKHKKRHRPRTEVSPTSGVRWQGKDSNSVEILGSKLLGSYSSNSSTGKASEQEQSGKSSVVGLKHGPSVEKCISTAHSSQLAVTNVKKNKPKHSSSHQEWAICPDGPTLTSEKPSLKLKFISKPKTSPTKVEQSPFALSTKPKESTVPLKNPTSHIPVNVQQLRVPSSSAASKSVALVVPKTVEEKPKPAEEKPPPSTRLPEEESLPFKPFEKPVASKKSAFVSDALEDLLQGEVIDNKMKSLISPSTISVTNAKVVYKVPSRQSHSVKTLDMALKRLKPLNVSSPSYKETIGAQYKSEKKKKKKKHKHKDRTREKIKKDYVFGSGPDDLVRKLPKLPFASYGKTFARPLFAREEPASKTVGEKSKGFLAVRNVLSMSENNAEKRRLEDGGMQPEKKIKQEPIDNDEKLPPVIDKSILNIKDKVLNLLDGGQSLEGKKVLSEEGQAPSEKKVQKCPAYCRLGCICGSLNDSRSVREKTAHCRKVDCMFGCLCNRSSTQLVSGTRNRRPPTFSQDMFFYDDSHKFWRTGAIESLPAPADAKKLQLLDHLSEIEKKSLVSSCARTRLFETDKPDRWLKWKRRQQGGRVKPSVEKNQVSDPVRTTTGASEDSNQSQAQGLQKKPTASAPQAPLQSTAPLKTGNQGPQTQTKVDLKQQKQPRKSQHFIRLSVPGDGKSQSGLLHPASKPTNPARSGKKAFEVTTPTFPSAFMQSNEGQVISTFLPVAKQYVLNGNLMNMLVLPNGNRILLPATSALSYTVQKVDDRTIMSPSAEVRTPTQNVDGAQSSTMQKSIPSMQPTANPLKNKTKPSAPASAHVSATPGVHAGLQTPVLPIRYQITSSGIKVTPGVVGTPSSQTATDVSSDYAHGTLNLVPQASTQNQQIAGSSETCKPVASVSQPLPNAGATSTPSPVQLVTKSNPSKASGQIASPPSITNNEIDSQSTLHRATLTDSVKDKTAAESDSNVQKTVNLPSTKNDAVDSECSDQGSALIDSAITKTVERSNHNVQRKDSSTDVQKGNAVKSSVQSGSSKTISHGIDEELDQGIRKEVKDREIPLTKTFFLDVEGSETYVILSFDADCKWTESLECSVKQEICKFIKEKKPAGVVQSLRDMCLKLLSWDTRRYCVRLRLSAKDPRKQVVDEANSTGSDKKTVQCDEQRTVPDAPSKRITAGLDMTKTAQLHSRDTDALNRSHESNVKMQPKAVGSTGTAGTAEKVPTGSHLAKQVSPSNISKEANLKTQYPVSKQSQSASPKGTPKYSNVPKLKRAASTSESTTETSTKLSSSLPEFEKLSAIVKRNPLEDDAGLSPAKKIAKTAMDWLNDPKIVTLSEQQNYSGMRGPWFTTEKESVKVVLQKKKQKNSLAMTPQKISSKKTTSSVLIISPKKSTTDEDTTMHMENSEPVSVEKKSLSDTKNKIFGTEDAEELDEQEGSAQKSGTKVSSDDEVPSESGDEGKALDSEDNKDEFHLDESSGILVKKGHASPSTKQSVGDLTVDSSKESTVNEKTMVDEQSNQHSSAGAKTSAASSKLSDVRSQDGVETEKEDEGCLDIEHFARFSEEDAFGSMDFDDDASESFDLPTFIDDDDSSSVASLRIDESVIGDEMNSDLEKGKSTSKDENKRLSSRPLPASKKTDSHNVGSERNTSAHPSLATDIPCNETTPVKHIKTNNPPKKSPMLNIKFVATSNENCTIPICLSPLSDVASENSQERSPTPVRSPILIGSNDPSESALSDLEPLSENVEEIPAGPSEAKDLGEGSSICKKLKESSVNFDDQLDDGVSTTLSDLDALPVSLEETPEYSIKPKDPLGEELSVSQKLKESSATPVNIDDELDDTLSTTVSITLNLQDSLPTAAKTNVTPEPALSDGRKEQEVFQSTVDPRKPSTAEAPSKAMSEEKYLGRLLSPVEPSKRSDDTEHSVESRQDIMLKPVNPDDSLEPTLCTNELLQDGSQTAVGSNDKVEFDLACNEVLPLVFQARVAPDDRSDHVTTYNENSAVQLQSPVTSNFLSEMAPTCTEESPVISTAPVGAPVASHGKLEMLVTETDFSIVRSPIPAKPINPSQLAESDTEIDVVNTDDDDVEIDVETVVGASFPNAQVLNPYSSLRDITSRLSSALKKEEEQKVIIPRKIKPKPKQSDTSSFGTITQNKLSGNKKSATGKIPLLDLMKDSQNIEVQLAGQSLSSATSQPKKKKKKEKTKRKSPLCPSKQWDSPQFREVYGRTPTDEHAQEVEGEGLTRLKLHNILERKRRGDLRKSFGNLGEVIDLNDARTYSKIMILKKAKERIKELKEKEEEFMKMKKQLKEHQRRLVYVHSNLLHHARCSGQINFPEGSRLAESMDRIRLGMGKSTSSTSQVKADTRTSSALPQTKAKKRKVDYLTKSDDSASEGRSYLEFKKKKKGKEKKSEDMMLNKSISSSKTAPGPSSKSWNVPRIYPIEEIVKCAISTERKNSGSPLDLSSMSDSRKVSQNVFKDLESSGDEESLPIECYVSSSDDPQEVDDGDFGMDEDEEQYSDDGFIPASDDEDTTNVKSIVRSSDENKRDKSDQETADVGLLDSFKPVQVLTGSCRVSQKSRLHHRKDFISLDSSDSNDDVLVIDEARSSGKLKKRDRTKLGSHGEKNKIPKQMGALKSHKKDQSSRIVHSIPSEVSSGAESSSSRTAVETKPAGKVTDDQQNKAPLVNVIDEIMIRLRGDTSAESSAGEEKATETPGESRVQSNVQESQSDDRQNRPKAPKPPLASAGTATGNIQRKAKEQASTTLKPKEHGFLSKETSSNAPLGQVGLGRDKSRSNSTRTETPASVGNIPGNTQSKVVGNENSTLTDKAVKQGLISISSHPTSNSNQGTQNLHTTAAFKRNEDKQQVTADNSDSKSSDKIDKEKKMATPKTTTSSAILSEKEKSSDLPLKHKMEELMKKGLGKFDELSNDSDLDSSDEEEQEVSTSTLQTKDTGSQSKTIQDVGAKNTFKTSQNNPGITSENNTSILPMKGASDSTKDTGKSSSNTQGVRKENPLMAPQKISSVLSTTKRYQSLAPDTGSASVLPKQQNTSDFQMEGAVAYTDEVKSVLRKVSEDLEDILEKNSATPLPNDTTEVSMSEDVTTLPKKGALADLISSMKTRVGNDDASDVSDQSESEDEADSDDDEASDGEASDDEELSGEEGKVEEEDAAKEDDIISKDKGSGEQNAISTAGSNASGNTEDIEKLDSSVSIGRTDAATAAVQNKDSSENLANNSVNEMIDPPTVAQEKDHSARKLDQTPIDDDSTGLSFTPNELQVGFSADDDISDDDAACLSYAAMGNDEDNEALFDAEDRDSPFSPLSLDMNIASDDDVVILDDEPGGSQPAGESPSVAGTSSGGRQRPHETSPRAAQSPGGHQKPSTSSRQDLTLDEAISFLNVEKNSDGTVNVFLKGDYDDQMLDELFKKPGVMDYIMKTVSKK